MRKVDFLGQKLRVLETELSYDNLMKLYKKREFNDVKVMYETEFVERPFSPGVIEGAITEISYAYFPFVGGLSEEKKSLGWSKRTVSLDLRLRRAAEGVEMKKTKILRKEEQEKAGECKSLVPSGTSLQERIRAENYYSQTLKRMEDWEGVCFFSGSLMKEYNNRITYKEVFSGETGKKLYYKLVGDSLLALIDQDRELFQKNCNEYELRGIVKNLPKKVFALGEYPHSFFLDYTKGDLSKKKK